MLAKDLNFPVILFANGFIQGAVFSEKQLCLRTIESFDSGVYGGSEILDSSGALYKVIGVVPVKNVFTFCDNFFVDIQTFFSRSCSEKTIWLKLELEFLSNLDFQSAKCKVAEFVSANGWFKRSLESSLSIEQRLERFKTIAELCGQFRGYSSE